MRKPVISDRLRLVQYLGPPPYLGPFTAIHEPMLARWLFGAAGAIELPGPSWISLVKPGPAWSSLSGWRGSIDLPPYSTILQKKSSRGS